ncbi:hypothetical protein Ddye_025070 [Dipteronia dyeriana]|uniref:RNase H type-1 domain-containing protein n=1 Tax=Dipteronia dyeriana TaxID=168575 RepID=A0AAD9WUU8_9ROSI|nr:hypothetical protein Ddye_025070 [Dipteronia dyeriana]
MLLGRFMALLSLRVLSRLGLSGVSQMLAFTRLILMPRLMVWIRKLVWGCLSETPIRRCCFRLCSVSLCVFPPKAGEASATLRGMSVAVDADLILVVLESDAKWVVDAINDNRPSCADIGIILRDIVSIMSEFSTSVSFVPR